MKQDLASMFPVWASPEAVRILDEKPEQEKPPFRHRMTVKQERFIKRYAFAIGFVIALAVYSVLIGCITGTIVRRNTIIEMEAQYRGQMQMYLDEQEQQRMAKSIVTGDESRAAAMKADAKEVAKALYGIRNFISVYHYTETDLRTYARCIFNRSESKGVSVHEIVSAKDQFIGYSEDNPVMDEYYNLALKFVDRWYYEETKPMSADYQWAELTPDGVFLVNEYGASGYVKRLQDD